jgi:uncharacterized membrane protein YkoI
MTRSTAFSAFALALLFSGTAAAQNPPAPPKPAPPKPHTSAVATHQPAHRVHEAKPGLLKQAKITPEAAEQTALSGEPGGTVTSRKIEMEKSVLVYAFNVKTTGKTGYDVVTVDANTGGVVATTHKSAMAPKPKKP